MKLRNKKTGEIVDVYNIYISKRVEDGSLTSHENVIRSFDSLAELNEEWEDYKPEEPRINNDDARDAVYSWASSHQIFEVKCKKTAIGSGLEVVTFEAFKLVSAPRIAFASWCLDADVVNGEIYTITELCGEDEE